jgi:hypothetical protein
LVTRKHTENEREAGDSDKSRSDRMSRI